MTHKVKLVKIRSTHSNLRTPFVVGKCNELPRKGKCFMMWAPPIDTRADIRMIDTTVVQTTRVIGASSMFSGAIEFETKNSLYQLEILDDDCDRDFQG